jgi:hypothetical protein
VLGKKDNRIETPNNVLTLSPADEKNEKIMNYMSEKDRKLMRALINRQTPIRHFKAIIYIIKQLVLI